MKQQMMKELYRKHRPTKLSQVVGQAGAVSQLRKLIEKKKVPHTILFHGPSGCGKTTLARIMAKELGCSKADFTEVDCADFRGIDLVRDIKSTLGLAPMGGKVKVWLIDEIHKMTQDGQSALLKTLEDTPSHVYFLLCTTDPDKLLATVRTRCTEIRVNMMQDEDLQSLLESVLEKEKDSGKWSDKETKEWSRIVDAIIEKVEGSARRALVVLNQVIDLDSKKEMLKVISRFDTKNRATVIARELIQPAPQWDLISKLLRSTDHDPETMRRMILGYAGAVLLGGGRLAPRALLVVDVFKDNFYDCGKAGLVAACYAVSKDKTK
jgi:DNA polymerase III gamma/tau subunit